MAYTANPYDVLQPAESVFAGTAAAEFRALKLALQAISTGSLYLGDWAAFTAGAGPHPAARGNQLTHLGKLWMLKVASADVELIPPSDLDTVNWFKLYEVSPTGFVESTGVNGSAKMPSGTTAQRDVTPAAGYTRWNTTLECNETWNGTHWVPEGWIEHATLAATGTDLLFSGIPPWVREWKLLPRGVSANAAQNPRLRLGEAAGLVVAGYAGTTQYVNNASGTTGAINTDGAYLLAAAAAVTLTGSITGSKYGTEWIINSQAADHGVGGLSNMASRVTLPTPLTQMQFSTITGNFDAGNVSLLIRR